MIEENAKEAVYACGALALATRDFVGASANFGAKEKNKKGM